MIVNEDLKNKSGIYRIICMSKSYIGSSQNMYLRLRTHISKLRTNKHKNKHLQSAYLKYGEEAFSYEILSFCEKDKLFDLETKFILQFDTFNNGFNQSFNARSPEGYKHSDESRLKISKAKKGVKQRKEVVLERAKKLIGKKHSEEAIEKQRLSKLGEKNPMFGIKQEKEFVKERMKNCLAKERWNKNKTKESDERLLKISEKLKGRIANNRIKHELIDLETNTSWKADSLKALSLICPLSITTLHRLKKENCGIKISKKYKIIW